MARARRQISRPSTPGQHQVEDQRVPAAALQFAHARIAIGGVRHRIALVAQVHAQQLGDVGVVLDDQDAFGGFP